MSFGEAGTVSFLSLIHIYLNVGQEVYRDPESPQKLYVKYDSGFALFEAEKATKEETVEYLDYVHAGIRLATSDSLQLKLSNVHNQDTPQFLPL